MAIIAAYPVVRHLRSSATSFVEHLAGGTVRHRGPGASFWFRPLTAAISEVPVDDREQEVLVRVRTRDLQEVAVPGTVTYRFARPEVACSRVDFSIDLGGGGWQGTPLETVGGMIHGAVGSAVTATLAGMDLASVLAVDPAELARRVGDRLEADNRLAGIGIELAGVRFAVLRPEPDVERALQTPAREMIQQEADRATYERRALAVEREAAIGENELANQIELARRQEQLIGQEGANARHQAQDAAAADAIAAQAEASRTTAIGTARAAADRAVGQATADTERAKLEAYDGVSRDILLTLALRELAGNLPAVEHLVVTPDLVTGLISRLAVTHTGTE
jgi:regulator of protease activity HflC (stomatin/prohibitin superfamily)